MKRYKVFSAVFPIIMKEEGGKRYVLLHKRQNTGYMDGKWDIAGSGHIEENETAVDAVIRESREEIGITVHRDKVKFALVSHKAGLHGTKTYFDVYFWIEQYQGEPRIREPEKSSALLWHDADDLPSDMIEERKADLIWALRGEHYREIYQMEDDSRPCGQQAAN